MTGARARLRSGLAALGVLVACALAGAGASSASALDDPGSTEHNLSVTVGPGSGGSTTAPAAPSSSGTTTRTTVGASTVETGSITPPELVADELSLGGILYVSGLSTEYRPSIDPLSGDLEVRFTVRNVSGASIDSSARFWVTNVFGAELAAVDPVEVPALKPDESRVVSATLSGVGQWTFATAHMTLTPPETVDGVALEPLTRETFVVLPPWFLIVLALAGGVASVVVRLVRAGRPVVAPAVASPGLVESIP